MFIDEARIRIKAGDGGNGCMAFRREKFVPRGGPSGGDGGHGGDILMSSSLSHNTLVHFRFNPEHKAQRGGHGLGSNCSGYAGESTTLKVPPNKATRIGDKPTSRACARSLAAEDSSASAWRQPQPRAPARSAGAPPPSPQSRTSAAPLPRP